ncbi:MAG TPA: hypothetical protein VD735_05300 [Candidatus Saccharimonadales bacterium]|nr:hypothetical protein [Candidatus Saccharimonadales bacterium]
MSGSRLPRRDTNPSPAATLFEQVRSENRAELMTLEIGMRAMFEAARNGDEVDGAIWTADVYRRRRTARGGATGAGVQISYTAPDNPAFIVGRSFVPVYDSLPTDGTLLRELVPFTQEEAIAVSIMAGRLTMLELLDGVKLTPDGTHLAAIPQPR